MTLKSNAKLKEKLTRGLKNDKRNFVNFYVNSRISDYLYFDRLLLSKAYKVYKAYKVLDEKAQKSYVS